MGSLSDTLALGAEGLEDGLEHYGIKGMKWGVRRPDSVLDRLHTPVSEDHASSRAALRKPASQLSNQEMQHLITRMDLERRYSTTMAQINAKPPSMMKKAASWAADLMVDIGKSELTRVAKAKASIQVEKEMVRIDSKVAERITPKPKKDKKN